MPIAFRYYFGSFVTYITSLGKERARALFLSAVNVLLTVGIVCEPIPLVISVWLQKEWISWWLSHHIITELSRE